MHRQFRTSAGALAHAFGADLCAARGAGGPRFLRATAKACAAGMSVLYRNAAALCTQLREAREQLVLGRLEERLRRADLLILDELSYVRLERYQSELLLRVVADRSERGSIIVTTNQAFAAWGELIDNEALATALIDRLIYRSITLDLSGPSYRLAQTRRELGGAAGPSPA